ncbi:AhpC/Tsa family protein GSU0066 [hydrothermal vent metagenome]|uniref:thioredoxin-dependent peroxiredoxin n=1 Tax=hydrothermal vent metagenome TaxID=652676 RepID=A0A3B0XPW8_9ZZZZ
MLNHKLRETVQKFRESLPKELSALIEQGAGEISALDIIERARKVGSKAPSFALKNQTGHNRSLNSYLPDGPLVITFYRGTWCPYCNLQLKEYGDHLSEIRAAGATLIAITPEKPGALDNLKASGAPKEVIDMAVKHVEFDVLHDPGNRVAESYGVIFKLPESHQQLLEQLQIDIEKLNGDSSFTFPDPATYVIKPDGRISWAFIPNNYRKRAEVEQILTALS